MDLKYQRMLQRLCEKKKLSKHMKQEIRGWDKIAARLDMTIPTAIKLAKDSHLQLPVTIIGRVPVTTEEQIMEWINSRIESKPYWQITKDRPLRKKYVRRNKAFAYNP